MAAKLQSSVFTPRERRRRAFVPVIKEAYTSSRYPCIHVKVERLIYYQGKKKRLASVLFLFQEWV